jgi:hypothetical protein
VLGVVVELPINGSHDTVAAYADGRARYLNHGGGVIVVEDAVTADVAKVINACIELGQQLANVLGVWEGQALPTLGPNTARVELLTPGGIRFGQAPLEQLQQNAMANEVIKAAMLTAALLVKQTNSTDA